jgi:spermidine synthase
MEQRVWLWSLVLLLWLGAGLAWGQRERILTRRTSPFGELMVTESGHQRILKMRQGKVFVEQSRCDVRRPAALLHQYSRLQMLGVLYPQTLERVLVVGLGGGSLSKALLAAYPGLHVDSIELDPEIVRLARSYFFYQESERARTFVCDAREHLQHHAQQYDLIVLDAYDGLEIPAPLRTRQFYQLVQKRLRPGGVVVSNLHRRSESYDRDRATLASVFQATQGINGTGLVVVMSGERLQTQPERWATAIGFDYAALLALAQPKPDWQAQAQPFED